MSSISLDTLNAADRATFMAAIGEVMELAAWVADEAYAKRPFASMAALYQTMVDAVRNAGDERLRACSGTFRNVAGDDWMIGWHGDAFEPPDDNLLERVPFIMRIDG